MISLESTLIPERDFVRRRLRERAASLLTPVNMDENDIKRVLKNFYDIRSTVAHGADTTPLVNIALENANAFEKIVRMVIVEALRKTPVGDSCREAFLKRLFDVCDQTRAEQVYNDFCVIKDQYEKNRCFDRISKRLQNPVRSDVALT
jgi:hypothetical protein